MNISKIILFFFILIIACANYGRAQQSTAGGDLRGTFPGPTIKKLQGRPVSSIAPAVGQVLRWNGTAWEAAADNAGSASQTPATAKPSVLYFNQSNNVNLYNPNIDTLPIPGLDAQPFTLLQSSRVIFHTVIEASAFTIANMNYGTAGSATNGSVRVEILNPANEVVARSTSYAMLYQDNPQGITSVGIGVLPAGTYHTRVSIKRQGGGAHMDIITGGSETGSPRQGGQMILEIFPD